MQGDYQKNTYCSYCGAPFNLLQTWPRRCENCGQVSYLNPLPVSVVLLPVGKGLLAIRRAIEPHKGRLALPGGYIVLGETWQQAGAREMLEETGIWLDPQDLRIIDVHSAPDGTILIFGLAPARLPESLPPYIGDQESSQRTVIHDASQLAFSLHSRVAARFLADQDHQELDETAPTHRRSSYPGSQQHHS
jgi:ADP-ribose pyrophosphatase YjhB (NUDIX family)